MKTVWKFPIILGVRRIGMPQGAKILCVDEQLGEVCLWAEVDTEKEDELRYFDVFSTGHMIPEGMGISREYVGTAKLEGGDLMFHVYEYLGV